MKLHQCFISPCQWLSDIKTHNYCINWKYIFDPLYINFPHLDTEVFFSFRFLFVGDVELFLFAFISFFSYNYYIMVETTIFLSFS